LPYYTIRKCSFCWFKRKWNVGITNGIYFHEYFEKKIGKQYERVSIYILIMWHVQAIYPATRKTNHPHLCQLQTDISFMCLSIISLYYLFLPPRYNWNIVESGAKHHKLFFFNIISNCYKIDINWSFNPASPVPQNVSQANLQEQTTYW
jgi:hypothetical protein